MLFLFVDGTHRHRFCKPAHLLTKQAKMLLQGRGDAGQAGAGAGAAAGGGRQAAGLGGGPAGSGGDRLCGRANAAAGAHFGAGLPAAGACRPGHRRRAATAGPKGMRCSSSGASLQVRTALSCAVTGRAMSGICLFVDGTSANAVQRSRRPVPATGSSRNVACPSRPEPTARLRSLRPVKT